MKLRVTPGNFAWIDNTGWAESSPATIVSSTATRRIITWQSGEMPLRADIRWNASTTVVSSYTIQYRGYNGAWQNWLIASGVNLRYTSVVGADARPLNGHDVLDFRQSGGTNQLFGASGNDILYGGNYADGLDGGTGNDVLRAGGGDDMLIGGAGSDRLTTGSGADRIRFMGVGDRGDIISDFSRGSDRLEFRSAGFGRLSRGTLSSLRFQSLDRSSNATRAGVRFVFNRAQNALYYDSDGSGARAAVKIATFSNGASITASDILVV